MELKGFEEYKKKRYPHHCHPEIFSRLMMAEDITDAYAAGMKAVEQCAAQAERDAVRDAVRECEKISKPRDKHVAMMIRKRYPQHFEGSDDTNQRGPIRPVIFHRRG